MIVQPTYFESIRQKAAVRWQQLEQDPELAAPWHQLFKQVQSPRHVLSELLQNADDAGATEAIVRIEDNVFFFEHNGEDFTQEHFASLCRFGYSNKRALHTIGFRGIGFKSTFSLGDCVELFTPTLAVSFDRKRFTEPRWNLRRANADRTTCVRVSISDQHRQKELEKNLEEWLKSPFSLLFFKNIRRLQIGDRSVHWRSLGQGPILNSEWMGRYEHEEDTFLLLRSEAKMFPEEALAEIRQERMLGSEDDADFPPCKIEIVLGAKGRLFVVLPTGVETKLPFACNAPFIQDPARLKIKDPETSPTNRWLLERAGQLAATAMLSWLSLSKLPITDRARAYGLLPDVDRQDNTLEGICGATVEVALAAAIVNRPLLLTDDGALKREKESVILPKELFHIWSAEQVTEFFDVKKRPPLNHNISGSDQKKLLHWGFVDQIDKQTVLRTLQNTRLPKPQTWHQLMNLWLYVAPEITSFRSQVSVNSFRILPVQGKDVLYAASEVVRLGEKKLLQSEDDWDFLATHLIVLNQNWPRYLAEQRRSTASQNEAPDQEAVKAAYEILDKTNLVDTSDVSKVIEQVTNAFFSQKSLKLQECVRLAQIAAKLGATVGNTFRYVTRDLQPKVTTDSLLFDEDGTLEELLPKNLQNSRLLHTNYTANFSSCSQEEWLKWISSGRSGLMTFVPLVQTRTRVWPVEAEAHKRGLKGNLVRPYVTYDFVVDDWDFEESNWQHWQKLAATDNVIWAKLVERIMRQRAEYWNRARSARLLQIATTGSTRPMTDESLLPNWVLRLQDQACLPDTRGFYQKPGDLLRRTPTTEPLLDIELFVHGRLDNETTRPLLDLLGVRNTPTGPDRLLDRLRALAKAENPPIREVEKYYIRLDQLVDTSSSADFQKIKQAFRSERLVLTQDGSWATSATVFLSADEEDVPGVAIIRSSVRDLTIWSKIDIAPRATAELAIQWLKNLPSGRTLAQDDARRVRALLARHAIRIWQECEHWLNLEGEWAHITTLSFVLTMQSLIPWQHLHQWVKQKTADLRSLSTDVTSNQPFSVLPPLAQQLKEQLNQNLQVVGQPEKKAWLTIIGSELQRIELDTESETQRVRGVAERLAKTEWQVAQRLEIIPYLDGTPAGTSRPTDVIWFNHIFYVTQLPKPKLAKCVPEELNKAFSTTHIKAALDYSFERPSADVQEYLDENFKLTPRTSLLRPTGDAADINATEKVDESTPKTATNSYGASNIIENGDTAYDDDGAEPEEPSRDDTGSTHDPNQPAARPRPAPKPTKPSIIERFAQMHGFRKQNDERFVHEDGSWIGRTIGSGFPWGRGTGTGNVVRHYWPKEHYFDREPLQLESDVWNMLDNHSEDYALILLDTEGKPVEITGTRLRAMRDQGTIILYPASYRLVYKRDNI